MRKSLALFLITLLVIMDSNRVYCSLNKAVSDLNNKVVNMMETGHKVKDAKDAIQSVLNLLFDLRGLLIIEIPILLKILR
jgi:hypothetical protein